MFPFAILFFFLPALCGASSVPHMLELLPLMRAHLFCPACWSPQWESTKVIPGSAVLGMHKITGLTGFPCWQHRQHPCTSDVRTAELRAGRNLHVVRKFMTTFGWRSRCLYLSLEDLEFMFWETPLNFSELSSSRGLKGCMCWIKRFDLQQPQMKTHWCLVLPAVHLSPNEKVKLQTAKLDNLLLLLTSKAGRCWEHTTWHLFGFTCICRPR